jgi:hypothetical protein
MRTRENYRDVVSQARALSGQRRPRSVRATFITIASDGRSVEPSPLRGGSAPELIECRLLGPAPGRRWSRRLNALQPGAVTCAATARASRSPPRLYTIQQNTNFIASVTTGIATEAISQTQLDTCLTNCIDKANAIQQSPMSWLPHPSGSTKRPTNRKTPPASADGVHLGEDFQLYLSKRADPSKVPLGHKKPPK